MEILCSYIFNINSLWRSFIDFIVLIELFSLSVSVLRNKCIRDLNLMRTYFIRMITIRIIIWFIT